MTTIRILSRSISFRLAIMVIILAILWVSFLNYTNKISVNIEKASVLQTENIINSTLVVIFATYAVKGELDRLNELVGANPFVYLAEYQALPVDYQGEIDGETATLKPGWYYLSHRGEVEYVPHYIQGKYRYKVKMDYEDVNKSNRYDVGVDNFLRLVFVRERPGL